MLHRKTRIERKSRPRRRSPHRSAESKIYNRDAAFYLAKHPFCQIWIARHRLDEDVVIAQRGLVVIRNAVGARHTDCAPRATEIHHRNKRDGLRLLDQRWWMAVSRREHDWAENNKTEARLVGFLLPINASIDGTWGDGERALPTPEFMQSMIAP